MTADAWKGVYSSARVNRNTFLLTYEDGREVIRFHGTNIITFKDSEITLDSGGFKTLTAKNRMNDWLKIFRISVVQSKGKWYVVRGGKPMDETQSYNIFPFEDGMTLPVPNVSLISIHKEMEE